MSLRKPSEDLAPPVTLAQVTGLRGYQGSDEHAPHKPITTTEEDKQMTMTLASEIQESKATLNVKKTESDAAKLRYEELQSEMTELKARFLALRHQSEDAFTAMTDADYQLSVATGALDALEAHQAVILTRSAALDRANVSVNLACTREVLVKIVEDAIASKVEYHDGVSFGESTVRFLEITQLNGGMHINDLNRVSVHAKYPYRGVASRTLRENQKKRAFAKLQELCPERKDGALGTPYALTLNDDGNIQRPVLPA